MIFDKSAKIIQWGKDNLFNKWHCKKWITICKIMELDPYLIPYTKFNSKWVRDKQQHILYSTGKYSHYLIITLYTHTHTHTHTHHGILFSLKKERNSDILYSTMSIQISGEGNGNPFQYSCLENPMDRGALAGYSPWGGKESDMTKHVHTMNFQNIRLKVIC